MKNNFYIATFMGILCVALLFVISCGVRKTAHVATTQPTAPTLSALHFSTDILPIVETHCKGCHTGASPTSRVSLDSYTNFKAKGNSIMYRINLSPFADKFMPANGKKLDPNTIAMIQAWINQGSNE